MTESSNPVRRYKPDSISSRDTFLVVQDLFLTETAALADVVLPAACAYEKSGTFTNTCGGLQFVKKAGDVAGPKNDLEIMAHFAHKMGYDVKKLYSRGEFYAPIWDSREACNRVKPIVMRSGYEGRDWSLSLAASIRAPFSTKFRDCSPAILLAIPGSFLRTKTLENTLRIAAQTR